MYGKSINVSIDATIVEKKAPTDDSIKLLNEFEEKARQNIIGKLNITDNTLNGIAIAYTDNTVSASTKGMIYFKFSINGEEYNLKEEFDLYEYKKEHHNFQLWLEDRLKGVVAHHLVKEMNVKVINILKDRKKD